MSGANDRLIASSSLAGGLALGKRRIIEEWEAHGALDFEGALAGQKHRGRVRVDALDRSAPMRCLVGKECKHLLLALALAHARHRCSAIGRAVARCCPRPMSPSVEPLSMPILFPTAPASDRGPS